MVIASGAGAPPPGWLDTLGKIAGVILGFELIVVLLIFLGLIIGLVLGLRWLNMHIVPVLHENAPKARHVMQLTEQNADRVVSGVAEFYGRRQAVRTGIRVLLFGKQSAQRLHEDSLVQAATDLDLMETGTATLDEDEHGAGAHRRRSPRGEHSAQNGHDAQNGHRTPHDDYSHLAGNAG